MSYDPRLHHLHSYERILRTRLNMVGDDRSAVHMLLALLDGTPMHAAFTRPDNPIMEAVVSELDQTILAASHEQALCSGMPEEDQKLRIPPDLRKLLFTLIVEQITKLVDRAYHLGFTARYLRDGELLYDEETGDVWVKQKRTQPPTGGASVPIVCFACAAGVSAMPSSLIPIGDIAGCCKICHAFFCGGHAHRNARIPQYECVLCVPRLLAQSAAAMVDAGAVKDPGARKLLAALRQGSDAVKGEERHDHQPLPQTTPPYPLVDTFLEEWKGLGNNLTAIIRTADWGVTNIGDDNAAEILLTHMPQEARRLLGTGKLVADRFEIHNYLPTVVTRMFTRIRNMYNGPR